MNGRIENWERQPLRLDPTSGKRQAEKRERAKLAKSELRYGHVTSTPIVDNSEVDHTVLNHTVSIKRIKAKSEYRGRTICRARSRWRP